MADFNLLSDSLALTEEQKGGQLDDSGSQNLHNHHYFVAAMNHNYNEIAERYFCGCSMSERRLLEAHDYWREDASRTFGHGIDGRSPSLDHFKHAAFICFWLRRTNPINSIQGQSPVPRDRQASTQKFYQYGNEICAIFIGLQICLFYTASQWPVDGGNVTPIRKRAELLRRMSLPPDLLEDFAMILKHKNMSPHAIYLMYKSLFNNTLPSM